ncbi:MAG: hypothetical protein LQ350_006089 [Teloschistes chrysophthalmus]|nr:MAG: hypothetical protein LQ350_006089 [Niorma chrysophthalma]
MARPSMAPQRNLTLTEELEKLEQSITLTLQEIDHNFSRAHRIVTTGILPVVEKYAEHSSNIWESSKFWKQFFEASANVSLSGYEEPPEQGDDTVTGESATITTPSTSGYASPSQSQEGTMTPGTDNRQQHHHHPAADDSIMSTTPPEQSTPRQPRLKHEQSQPPPSMALYSSPYEALKREIKGQPNPHHDNDNSTLPSTPRNPFQSHPDEEYTPSVRPSTAHRPHRTPKDDPLLHRILDKNWRLQATPHTTTVAPKPGSTVKLPYRSARRRTPRNQDAETPAAADRKGKAPTAMYNNNNNDDDDDLDSSPALPAPELHSEIFGTPAARGRKTVPGVSVLTPARKIGGKQAAGDNNNAKAMTKGIWDSDSDDDGLDGEGGMSPPKTMQFHIPQSKLLRTPAREASKKIVEDLLHTAGGNVTDEYDGEESSPSVVKRVQMEEDDTF